MTKAPVLSLIYARFSSFEAKVAELVDARDLGSRGSCRGGSSPPFRIHWPFETFISLSLSRE